MESVTIKADNDYLKKICEELSGKVYFRHGDLRSITRYNNEFVVFDGKNRNRQWLQLPKEVQAQVIEQIAFTENEIVFFTVEPCVYVVGLEKKYDCEIKYNAFHTDSAHDFEEIQNWFYKLVEGLEDIDVFRQITLFKVIPDVSVGQPYTGELYKESGAYVFWEPLIYEPREESSSLICLEGVMEVEQRVAKINEFGIEYKIDFLDFCTQDVLKSINVLCPH